VKNVNGIIIIRYYPAFISRFIQYRKISITNWKKLLIQILYLF